ncbi:MAG: ATP-binding protein [Lentisphaerae bacterium]|nr:ATP-binding protein [Lentisphaerota bacterium]
MTVSVQPADWRDIIYRGIENQELDFKAAQDWNELGRAGRAKFARHAMAMANTRGGYLVVGVGEDENGNPTLHTGMTERQARSFDPSTVGQTVNHYADPSVEFDIVRPEVDGRRYVVFVVYPFRNLPHVCGDACEAELQRGVFYIRTPDARSRPAYRASELHGLVQRALRNQRELLGRMIRGVLYEGRQANQTEAEPEFNRLLAQSRQEARRALGNNAFNQSLVLEVAVYPERLLIDRLSLSDVHRARDEVVLPPEGAFPVLPDPGATTYASNDSIRSLVTAPAAGGGTSYLEVFLCGLMYCACVDQPSEAAPRELHYNRLLRWVGSAMGAVGQLYAALGFETDLLTIVFRLANTEGVRLVLPAQSEADALVCHIPDIEVSKRRTAADVVSGPEANAAQVVREICERFGFRSDDHVGLNQRLEALLRLGGD